MLTQRAGSFERASRRRSEHAAAENIAKHISTAQAHHRERCGAELEKRDELTHIVQHKQRGMPKPPSWLRSPRSSKS